MKALAWIAKISLVSGIVLLSAFPVQAQIVFQETFDEPNGSTSGNDNIAGVGWSSSCPTCVPTGDWWEIRSSAFEGTDTNGPTEWITNPIDISGCTNFEISFDIIDIGDMEDCGTGCNSADWVTMEYNIGGSGWGSPANAYACGGSCAPASGLAIADGDVTNLAYSTGCVPATGATLQIRISVQTWAASESWRIDNITVTCVNPDAGSNGAITVCTGGASVNLFGVLGGTPDAGGTWSGPSGLTGGDLGTFNPATMLAGTYTYTVGSAPCQDDASVTVTITGNDPGTNGAVSFCSSDPSSDLFNELGGTPDAGGTWAPALASGTGVFNPAVDAGGTYTYTVGAGVCAQSADVVVTLNASVNAGTNGNTTLCDNDPSLDLFTLLGGTPDSGGSWSPALTSGTGVLDPSIDPGGVYTYTVGTGGNCDVSATVDVTIAIGGDPIIDPSGPFCEDNAPSALLAASPGGSWSATCASCIDINTGVFDPASAGPGTWTVTYTIPGACGSSDTEDILVIATDDATVAPAGPFCSTDPAVTLTSADPGGTWSAACGACINAATGDFDPAIAGAGTWTVTYTISGACGSSDSQDITVTNLANATIDAAGPFCVNDPAVALTTADPGGSWTATCGACIDAAGIFNPSLAGSGIHTVTYTINGSCGDQQSTDITVSPNADASILPSGPYCEGFGNIVITSMNAGGTWSASCGGCIDPATGIFNTAVAGAGIHIITYSLGGSCPDQQNITVEVTPNDNATFTAPSALCDNDSPVQFTPNFTGGNWSATCSNCITPAGLFNPTAAGAGVHTVTYTIPGVCGSSLDMIITVAPAPVVEFSVDITDGCIPLTVTFSDLTLPAGTSYVWDFGDGNNASGQVGISNTYTNAGCYDVSLAVTTAAGCASSSTINNIICANAFASSLFNYSPSTPDVYNTSVDFTNLSGNASEFVWFFDSLGTSVDTDPTYEFPSIDDAVFNVCLVTNNAANCPDTSCQEITIASDFIAYVPNAFTPDGDGDNEVFLPVMRGFELESYHLWIFSRWGELIFLSEDPTVGWDGNYRGYAAKSDVYVWKLEATRKGSIQTKQWTGHVTLLR